MPARDECEPQVIRALEKAGWRVTLQPAPIFLNPGYVYADLLLQHNSSDDDMIILEVKCFPDSRSRLDELYRAIGQYLFYRTQLNILKQMIPLYLSVPEYIYDDFLSAAVIQQLFEMHRIHLVVINLEDERVEKWITW